MERQKYEKNLRRKERTARVERKRIRVWVQPRREIERWKETERERERIKQKKIKIKIEKREREETIAVVGTIHTHARARTITRNTIASLFSVGLLLARLLKLPPRIIFPCKSDRGGLHESERSRDYLGECRHGRCVTIAITLAYRPAAHKYLSTILHRLG